MIDEALEETFPASDPPANTVETGIVIGELSPVASDSVVDNQAKSRFELTVNGETAFVSYERTNEALTLIHTEVPAALRGLHVGETLAEASLQSGRSAGLRIVAVCPFIRAYMRKQRKHRQ
jgi:predicted GNAT family acetyltransferase